MKVKLYFENEKAIAKSGIGQALAHQKQALALNDIPYTCDHRDQDYDVLHINTVWLASFFEVRRARRHHKAIVYHAHSTAEDFKNSFAFSNLVAPVYQKWMFMMYRYGDCIITPTPYAKSLLEKQGLKQPIYAISNGIDVAQFAYDPAKVQAFRDYFQIQDHEKVIISVGWLFERKGFDTFCEVAQALPQYRFIWFGDVQLSMPTAVVSDWIKNKPDNVTLPGYISGDVLKGAYLGCDLFFFPSREETEGIVVLEALASKAPVLVRDIGVYAGWLEDGKNCYMASDTAGFIARIEDFFAGKLPDLRNQGYETAKSRGIKEIGVALKAVYSAAMERKKARMK